MSAAERAEIQRLIQLHADACNIGMRVVAERDEARRERTEFEVEADELRATLAAVAALADGYGHAGRVDIANAITEALANHTEAPL